MSAATVTALPRTEAASQARKAARSGRGRTKLERAQAAAAIEALERQQKEATERAPRFSAQHKYVLIVLLGLAFFMAAASFVTSFSGLYGAAAWAVGEEAYILRVGPPLMFDLAIIAFTIKLFMDKEEGLPVKFNWVWIGVLATVSASANVFHTLTVTTATTLPELLMGCLISGSAPFLLALVVDVAASKVFKRPEATQ